MSSSLFVPSDEAFDAAGQRDLHAQTVRVAIDATAALAVGILSVSTIGFNRIDEGLFAVVVALAVVAGGSHFLYRYGPSIAAFGVVVGLSAVFSVAVFAAPSGIVAPWLSIVVLITSALFGWRWGAVNAALGCGLLLFAMENGMAMLSLDFATNAVLLGCSALFVSWLISRPTRVTLEWASSSYVQALTLIQEARERQAELAQLSKSLSESCYQLEQLNLEIDRARRLAHESRRLKEQFAAAVSHELRTPLNLIIGFCEMMVLSPTKAYGQRLPPSYRDDLEAIYRNAVHISSLVDDILDLSQINADRMALHRDWTALIAIVEEAVTPVAALFRNRGLSLDVQVSPDLPSIFVDHTRIRQILINLLANAARFTETGGVKLTARRDQECVIVAVADTGPGISEDQIPYVFEEFRQVSGLSQRPGGSGLGLAVSKRFAEMHDGTIRVESTVGRGTTFYLQLPIETATRPKQGSEPTWDDRLARRIRGTAEHSVLVIDRSGELGRILGRYLDGYRIVDLEDAHRNANGDIAQAIQAVVVGSEADHECWRRLSARSADLRSRPVFSCSLQTIRQAVAHLGVDDYLLKPVSRDHLRLALRRQGCTARKPSKVLIVDDDAGVLRLLTRMVKSISKRCQVLTADDGDKALALMRDDPPDCVLLDLNLPSVDGYGVIETMREGPQLRRIPILVITASGLRHEEITADELRLTRDGGLTIAEAVRWLKNGLDSALTMETNSQESTAAPAA